jgi:nucleoside-diphosphate-sugar epimerase
MAGRALVFGGSGQIGAAVIDRLLSSGWRVHAVSRRPRPDAPGLTWWQGEFAALPDLPDPCEAVFSCGPLDLFSTWYAATPLSGARVVAFGSTSLETKHGADDPAERALAQRLRDAESRVLDAASARGDSAVLLRPTLVYGNGRDTSLSRIAALATRAGFFVLPSGACGLRQPVHVEDLAQAACNAASDRRDLGQAYALPGGEVLPYREMVARTLAVLPSRPRLFEMPAPLFRFAVSAARVAGRLEGLPAGAVARMREDLVFDDGPARRDLGFAPRPFQPTARMFEAA